MNMCTFSIFIPIVIVCSLYLFLLLLFVLLGDQINNYFSSSKLLSFFFAKARSFHFLDTHTPLRIPHLPSRPASYHSPQHKAPTLIKCTSSPTTTTQHVVRRGRRLLYLWQQWRRQPFRHWKDGDSNNNNKNSSVIVIRIKETGTCATHIKRIWERQQHTHWWVQTDVSTYFRFYVS